MTPTETDPITAPPQSNGTAGGLSLLSHLANRREEVVHEQVLDKRVPRWSNPEIWVRYEPVDFDVADSARQTAGKLKGKAQTAAILLSNIDAMIQGCIGVYAVLEDDDEHRQFSLRPNDPEGELTTFDRDLAVNLGLNSEATARQVVRTLFITEGDILAHAEALSRFSGFATQQADDALGES